MADTRLPGYLRGRAGALAVLAAWSVLEAGQTFLMGYALAKALDDGFLPGRPWTGLAWLALTAASVPVGAYGTARVFRALAGLVEPLRDLLVRRVVRGGLRAAVARGRAGDSSVVSRLTHQVEIARDAFGGLVLVLRSFVFTAAGALAGLCALAPVLLLIVVPPLAAGIGLFAAALRPLARRQHRCLATDEALAEELGALTGGLRDITACGAEDPTADRADRRIDAELRASRSLARWSAVRAGALAVGGQVPVVLLLVGGPWLLRTHRVTPGALLGALAYLTQSLQPALQNLVHTLSAAGTRLGVVLARITAADGDAPAAVAAPDPPPATGPYEGPVLRLRGVTFAYGPAAEPVLHDLDLTVGAGEHLAVVGPSGIGKSTLAALAAGLLRPDRGTVRTAGRPALVPQEAYVFAATVAENLRYLCGSGPSDATVLAAVRAVGAAQLVSRLGGLAAEVDPGALSAGERQLIALARTYLAPARLVVLDEATCHLDPAAEAVAEEAFARRPGGTLVVVAHRISSARRADRVLVLDGTRAVCGTHHDLPARSPLYRDLVGGWSAPAPAPPPHGRVVSAPPDPRPATPSRPPGRS
ncbi:ATP-binding cassette, subfamily C [Streptomyces sp. DvalAA-14]|uniref:ATP-binding cassette domain-containing protein n=1 Tax=unclassified Streptomyces TaxID=2593676 RepID=UPI00081B2B6B|nr:MULTISPECIES: ABC transporter ATP-binding protein [unclassified Streptomyces]MYS21128.1 ATP-binding cassette domain-containing protein [Streptomyces sp. SID4948]SCD84766.1 ATP-binding cassette, subfamily C [Streptomyces sp. DvalAA-14]